jgi:hypothetical protein
MAIHNVSSEAQAAGSSAPGAEALVVPFAMAEAAGGVVVCAPVISIRNITDRVELTVVTVKVPDSEPVAFNLYAAPIDCIVDELAA